MKIKADKRLFDQWTRLANDLKHLIRIFESDRDLSLEEADNWLNQINRIHQRSNSFRRHSMAYFEERRKEQHCQRESQ
jgi:hypothetical protein